MLQNCPAVRVNDAHNMTLDIWLPLLMLQLQVKQGLGLSGGGWVARGRHASARDPSGECGDAHPIGIGLGDGVEGSAKAPFIMVGVGRSWNAPPDW